jgi:hypothetical protein
MSHFEEDNFKEDYKVGSEDVQVEEALRNFRASVHAWSERELRPNRTPKAASRWMVAPAMAWGLASVLAVAAVTVPVSVHHERQVAAARLAAEQQQKQRAAAEAARAAANSMDDEALLNHVDSDIAQSTPDAMEPLASLMGETSSQ